MKVKDKKVEGKERKNKTRSFPATGCIDQFLCFNCAISSLKLENTEIQRIGIYAFAYCNNLMEVTFPRSLEEILEGSFYSCSRIETINFPSGSNLRNIGPKAFTRCYKLKPFDFPPLIEVIGESAFEDCSEFLRVDLSQTKVKQIQYNSFEIIGVSISLPPTIEPLCIVDQYFEKHIDEGHQSIKKDDCGYYFFNGIIFHYFERSKRFHIRRGVERIAQGCFFRYNLTKITIPASVRIISKNAFIDSERLRFIHFSKNSRLHTIEKYAFSNCTSINGVKFPKYLKTVEYASFFGCYSLEEVFFPKDSQLEKLETSFFMTSIRNLSLPPSIREIGNICYKMEKLESIFISNDLFQSNEEGTAIFSRDGSDLISVLHNVRHFVFPEGVRVIKKKAFYKSSISGKLLIPPSVEIIGKKAFFECYNLFSVVFADGSRLKSLAFNAFSRLSELVINNKNFITMENGVIMSMNPRGIVFVPSHLDKLKIDQSVEVIFSCAFYYTEIRDIVLPKSLKRIYHSAFCSSNIRSITFEEGTELETIKNFAFYSTSIRHLKLPLVKKDLGINLFGSICDVEFPPNFNIESHGKPFSMIFDKVRKVVCPKSSLSGVAPFHFESNVEFDIIKFLL